MEDPLAVQVLQRRAELHPELGDVARVEPPPRADRMTERLSRQRLQDECGARPPQELVRAHDVGVSQGQEQPAFPRELLPVVRVTAEVDHLHHAAAAARFAPGVVHGDATVAAQEPQAPVSGRELHAHPSPLPPTCAARRSDAYRPWRAARSP